jgi:hypothetical protein
MLIFGKKYLIFDFACGIIYRLMKISENITHTPFNNGGLPQVSSNTVG